MKQITKNNYEAFLLDFSEGNLSPAEMEMLFDFINSHPELEHELEDLERGPVLLTSHIGNKSKGKLLKDAKREDLYNLVIASTEGVATPQEKNYLKELVKQDSSLNTEIALFNQLKLKSDTQDQFSRKELLVKDAPVRVMPWVFRIAGVAALFVGVWIAINFNQNLPAEYVGQQLVYDGGDVQEGVVGINQTNDKTESVRAVLVSDNNPVSNKKEPVVNSTEFVETDKNIEKETEFVATYLPTKNTKSLFIEENLSAELMKLNVSPDDIKYDENNNPYFLIGLDNKVVSENNVEPLIQKVTILIDEKVEVKKDQDAFYIRIGRFTVSFVKSIFNKNE